MLTGDRGNVLAILLVFTLYLLVRPQHIKRPLCLLMAGAGLLLAIIGEFFMLGDSPGVHTVCGIFTIIGNIVAFMGLACTCFSSKLPVVDDIKLASPNEPKP